MSAAMPARPAGLQLAADLGGDLLLAARPLVPRRQRQDHEAAIAGAAAEAAGDGEEAVASPLFR